MECGFDAYSDGLDFVWTELCVLSTELKAPIHILWVNIERTTLQLHNLRQLLLNKQLFHTT